MSHPTSLRAMWWPSTTLRLGADGRRWAGLLGVLFAVAVSGCGQKSATTAAAALDVGGNTVKSGVRTTSDTGAATDAVRDDTTATTPDTSSRHSADAAEPATDTATLTADASVAADVSVADSNTADTGKPAAAATGDTTGATCATTWSVVSFTTADGLTLEADYRPASKPGRGAVVLVHMIPPSWNRKSWPLRVRNLLAAGDVAVLSIDRRGAGKSQGTAKDAYFGPGGAKDVAAAVGFLIDAKRPCASDSEHIALVGASNGTTSVLDYTIGHDATAPQPSAIAWLSPGSYTENQIKISANRPVLDKLPLLFVHPSTEPWSNGWKASAAKSWSFLEVTPGKHGTLLFDNGPMEVKTLKVLLPHIAAATAL